MNDRDALLAAIIDQPEDDAARLVYADWLDEHGSDEAARARAEFIRVQIALARLHDPDEDFYPQRPLSLRAVRGPATPEGEALAARQKALFDAHGEAWLAELPKWARLGADYRRGFSHLISRSLSAWTRSAAGLHRAAPITVAYLSNVAGQVERLTARPELGRLHELNLAATTPLTQADIWALASCPAALRLRRLHLNCRPDEACQDVAYPLLIAPWAGLEALALPSCGLGDRSAELIATSAPGLKWLRALVLDRNALTARGAEALAATTTVDRLAVLSLQSNRVGDDGALALVRSPRLRSLMSLNLWDAGCTNAGLVALAAEPGLARLRRLVVGGVGLGNEAVLALAASPHAANLEVLFLRPVEIRDEAALALASSPHLGRLRKLYIDGYRLGEGAKAALTERFPGAVV